MLRMFASHSNGMKVSGQELQDARKDLCKNYRERRLDLDATAWWWPSEFAREAEALKLLTPDEMKQLTANVQEYNASVLVTLTS